MSSPRRKEPGSSDASKPALAADRAQPRRFGDYLLVEPLAHGGMGEVWLARQMGMAGIDKFCVVKTMRATLTSDEEYQRRFIDEARTVVQLAHRNICQVFDVGAVGEEYFLAMELVTGFDFRALFQAGAVDEGVAVRLVGEMLEALDYAHRLTDVTTGQPLELVHRDVSLQNALVNLEGEVKLIDFGLAQSTLKNLRTQPGIVMGKTAYMSPEQARGDKLDGRSDQFSAAVVAYELLTGARYYGDAPLDVITRHVGAGDWKAPRLDSLPPALRAVLVKALDAEPSRRHASCAAMRKALLAASPAAATAGTEEVRAYLDKHFPDAREKHRERIGNASLSVRAAPVVPVEHTVRIASKSVAPATEVVAPVELTTDEDSNAPATNADESPNAPSTNPNADDPTIEAPLEARSSTPPAPHIPFPGPVKTVIVERKHIQRAPPDSIARPRRAPTVIAVALALLVVVVAGVALVAFGPPHESQDLAPVPSTATAPATTAPTVATGAASPPPAAPLVIAPTLEQPAPTPPPPPPPPPTPTPTAAATPSTASTPSTPSISPTTAAEPVRAQPTARKQREVKAKAPPLPSTAPGSLLELVNGVEASCRERVPCAVGLRARWAEANRDDNVDALKAFRASAEQCFAECRRKSP